MVKFKELGFKTFEDYYIHFINTLLPSNKTYEYFVNWKKVKAAVNSHLNELSLLNSLTKVPPQDREMHLQNLLLQYPKVVEVLPLLIAERINNGKIDVFDSTLETFLILKFEQDEVNEEEIPLITEFCRKSGILELFQVVKDLPDYLLGIEVGLDTNSRKNRSGVIFEQMCKEKIKRTISNTNYVLVNNDLNFSLYKNVSSGHSKAKKHDFVIYSGNIPCLVIECNFYNKTGSKPISIAESYIEMNRAAQSLGVEFLWVTDGPGWHSMKEPLLRGMSQIDWVLNYQMLGLIPKILKS